MKLVKRSIWLATAVAVATLGACGGVGPPTAPLGVPEMRNQPPIADAGRDFVAYADAPAAFMGYGASADREIVRYEWDFDGDGVYDERSTRSGATAHVYRAAGTYDAVLR